ncbi:hypothetical protein [Burkholderia sp. MSMB1072]|uniref:hypothetical protein n=1 Tax=Burkholderia sp. MSMB1072 TaxID=1637871 RepID=UPI0012E3BB0F|nr:hypothetical protein [Burkholderia sp. MSMB1072]
MGDPWFAGSMTEIVGHAATRGADGCFTGGDIDTLVRDVGIVVLARSPHSSRSVRRVIVRRGSNDGSSHKRPRFASSAITLMLRRCGVRRFVRQPLPPCDTEGWLWRQRLLSTGKV